jgi:undecaprenyl-diphosphatase
MNAASLFGGGAIRKDLPRILRVFLGAILALIAFSRIYLGVHTPIDILVGIVFGTLAGVMMYLLYCYLSGKLATQHTYYSSAYTSNGYRRSDFLLVVLFLALTLLYVSFNAIRLASQF